LYFLIEKGGGNWPVDALATCIKRGAKSNFLF